MYLISAPIKSIVVIQANLKSTLLNGYIEFDTANSPLSIGSASTERSSENSVYPKWYKRTL